MASRHFPAWLLGILPDSSVILTSYGESLAVRHSKAIRDQLPTDEYQAVFGAKSNKVLPVELSSDSRSNESWDLARPYRGGVKAAGVGGGITGLPAHLFIVDDPFKNREEAESESRRDLVDDWYKSAARTRLRPNAAVVIFHTRWHPDDLAGRLMQRMVSDPLASQFVLVCLPGLALESYPSEQEQLEQMREGVYLPLADPLGRKSGEALCPQWYPSEWLLATRADVGVYDFEALYQQSPYSRTGEMFRRDWFVVVDNGPHPEEIVMRVRYWDKAGTKTGSGGDYAAGVLMCLTKSDAIYVEHMERRQCTPMQREEMILQTARQDAERAGPMAMIWHQQDPGSAGLDSAQATNRMLAAGGFRARFETVTGDKEVRAGPWSSACQGGQVRLVRGGWNMDMIGEHAAFPKGRYDDQVDVCAGAFGKLKGRAPKEVRSYQG